MVISRKTDKNYDAALQNTRATKQSEETLTFFHALTQVQASTEWPLSLCIVLACAAIVDGALSSNMYIIVTSMKTDSGQVRYSCVHHVHMYHISRERSR
jgi:hypothetical protein